MYFFRSVSPSKKNYDKDNDNYKNYKVNYIIDKDESDKKRVLDSVDTVKFFDDIEMEKIETELDGVVDDARMKKFKSHTVETTRLRLEIFCLVRDKFLNSCFKDNIHLWRGLQFPRPELQEEGGGRGQEGEAVPQGDGGRDPQVDQSHRHPAPGGRGPGAGGVGQLRHHPRLLQR